MNQTNEMNAETAPDEFTVLYSAAIEAAFCFLLLLLGALKKIERMIGFIGEKGTQMAQKYQRCERKNMGSPQIGLIMLWRA